MIRRRNSARPPVPFQPFLLLACVAILLSLYASACKSQTHTSDVRLQKIDKMLSDQLPPGTTRGRVDYFLKSRGYTVEDSPDKDSLVAVVRQIDTDTLQPATARVTFRFDSNDKLISYELQPAPDAPLRP